MMPPAGVIGTGQFPEFLEERRASLQLAIDAMMKEVQYKSFTSDRGSAKMITERMQDMEPMQPLARWSENTVRPRMTVNPGWAHVISQMTLAGEVVITKMMRKFNRWDLMNMALTQMKRSSVLALEFLFINYLIYGEDTSVPTVDNIPIISHLCPDGQPLFSKTHRWRSDDSRYIKNMTDALDDISETSIFNLQKIVRRWRAPNGAPLNLKLDKLLIPTELERIARVVLDTDRDPDSANNAINTSRYFMPGGYEVNDYLPSAVEWYASTTDKSNNIMIKWGWPLETTKRLPENDPAGNAAICVDLAVGHAAPLMPLSMMKVTAG